MIVIRPCRGFEELQACVDLQIEVWGYCEGDVIPRRMFLVAQKIGGQAIGAFDTELPGAPPQGDAASMVGFSFSLPGTKANESGEAAESYLHSHMLAVKEGYRDRSIGRRLKLAQREDALARGIRRIEWTFDPLEIKNSFLNIHKLGAIVRRYEENFYGVSSSRLQGGLQTDRLVAEWWIDPQTISNQGFMPLAGRRDERSPDGLPESPNGSGNRPGNGLSGLSGKMSATALAAEPAESGQPSLEIRVPASIYQWKADDSLRHLASEVQAQNRQIFQRAFADGLTVTGFTRDFEGNGVFHLQKWSEPESPIRSRTPAVPTATVTR
jgi:predicted GNAT superfamily acetyltransferase